jgi:flagellar biosynthesis anti-sigma factor FlgM
MLDPVSSTSSTNPVRRPQTARRVVFPEDGVAGSPSGGDTADVAKTAALLAAIVEAAVAVPMADQERIAQLRQAIAAGTFEAHPQQISRSVVAVETLLYG